MRRRVCYYVLTFVVALSPAAVGQAALSFNWTNRATAGFSAAEQAVIDASFNIWTTLLPTPEPRAMTLNIGRGPLDDALGETFNFADDPLGNPRAASITIDSGTSFFVDPTPLDNSEYVPSGSPSHYNAVGGGAVNKWDLLSVVVHEIGHAIGFADNFDRFYAREDTDLVYHGDGFDAVLADGGHLDSQTDLMGVPGFGESERALPSPLDLAIFNDAFDYADKFIYRYAGPAVTLADNNTTRIDLVAPVNLKIEDVDVAFYILHNNDSHLDISIISPQDVVTQLSTDNGGSGNNYGSAQLWTRMDSQAIEANVVDFDAPFTGTFAPESSLDVYNGASSLGTWKLQIVDDTAGTAGTLQAFALIFKAHYAADFDRDRDVDAQDFARWQTDFGGTGVSADVDADADGGDFLIWQQQFATGVLATSAGQPAPEPSAVFLVLCTALALWRKT